MKTEPTEARIYIASYSCENGAGDTIIDREDADEAVNIAFREGQSSPKIKQLEWEELSREEIEADYEYIPKSVIKASTPFKYYTIHKLFTNIFTVNCSLEIYPSLNEAKAAVQSDFEKRIKECLE